MPPIVTAPSVIRCKVNSTVNIQIDAADPNGDPITYSLLYPRPPGASIGSGERHKHTHAVNLKTSYLREHSSSIAVTDDIAVFGRLDVVELSQ